MDRIPITRPAIDDTEIDAVTNVLRSGMLVQGEQVQEFERAIAASAGTEHAVAVSNCTVALEVALRGMGIGPGDHVVVTPYSWVATVNAIEIVGAKPVFVDIDPDTFNLCASSLKSLLEQSTVAAVLPVHTFGNLAGIDAIMDVASAANVPVLEDAACAIGAKSERGAAGGIGVAGCFSFHPRKVVTTGEGGAITTNDAALAAYARDLPQPRAKRWRVFRNRIKPADDRLSGSDGPSPNGEAGVDGFGADKVGGELRRFPRCAWMPASATRHRVGRPVVRHAGPARPTRH